MATMTDRANGAGPGAGRSLARVAVVVPMSFREEMTPEEVISCRHLTHHLSKYDKYAVVPRGSKIRLPGLDLREFGPEYFGSAAAHNRLMLSQHFYERFTDYEFLLVYHLDSLVFSDQLEEWCAREFDFIGPPWLPGPDTPWVVRPGVGNGGFCLRRTASLLRVLNSDRYWQDPEEFWMAFCRNRSLPSRFVNLPRKYVKYIRRFNGVERQISKWDDNEDRFWAQYATHYDPGFRIAPVDTALRFAFEADPRKCLELNGGKLPFGCHGWFRYDRAFWEPFLIR